jgi:hypothetical protein
VGDAGRVGGGFPDDAGAEAGVPATMMGTENTRVSANWSCFKFTVRVSKKTPSAVGVSRMFRR